MISHFNKCHIMYLFATFMKPVVFSLSHFNSLQKHLLIAISSDKANSSTMPKTRHTRLALDSFELEGRGQMIREKVRDT